MVAGTPQYMSPEQTEGKAVDPRTDLFSLGSVLYAMCTGRAPFRASGTLAVLKRVCEETPTPIRETNPGIPDWLVQTIDKLHAKDPSQRYQSATEVAELLGRHLAQVQHPSVMGQVANESPEPKAGSRPSTRRRLAIAAAGLVCLVAGLSLTEAAGVTSLRATVIRIFTPEGTLVVETDDPAVKVVVEGDGDLILTGAGPQEVRLRAGSYRLRATKDGSPVKLDRDLVTITRGDRQIVRVHLEDNAPAAAVPKAEREAFVRLGGKGVAERKFDSLAEAVEAASDGDIIEVRGNGPFVTQPVAIGWKGLTIRAATGFRPVIKGNAGPTVDGSYLLRSLGPLIIEGLELHMMGCSPATFTMIVDSVNAPLHVTNCRFVHDGGSSLWSMSLPDFTIRNCDFVGGSGNRCHVAVRLSNSGKVKLENNLFRCLEAHALGLDWPRPDLQNWTIHLNHNTVATRNFAITHGLEYVPKSAEPGAAPDRQPVQMKVSANLFYPLDPTDCVFSLLMPPDFYRKDARPFSAEEAKQLLPRLMGWREERNLYGKGWSFQAMRRVTDAGKPGLPPVDEALPIGQTFADWQRLWKAGDSGSAVGMIRFEGGDVLARMAASPERMTAADFRLRPDSAGYRAGKDGKDLGADIDLVGPGAAYERWKKTPDYQKWLKETGQK
jgi:hypothetical protein